MRERPILFSAPMVRAILAGTKTQTRRVVKHSITGPNPPSRIFDWHHPKTGVWLGAHGGSMEFGATNAARLCPYGQPGDRLWVRETWMDLLGTGIERVTCDHGRYAYAADTPPGSYGDDVRKSYGLKWKPSIHMPRAASRITLEIVSVRVERLQDISEADAISEGITTIWPDGPRADGGPNHYTIKVDYCSYNAPTATGVYAMLWDVINGPGSWDVNPFVWVVEFKRVTP